MKLAELKTKIQSALLNTRVSVIIQEDANIYVVIRFIKKSFMKTYFNTYKFSNHDIDMFFFLFRKGAYTYDYMDDWKKNQWNIFT